MIYIDEMDDVEIKYKSIYYLSDSMRIYLKYKNIELIELIGSNIDYNYIINFEDNWYYIREYEHKNKRDWYYLI